jgi:hypothetical protein
LCDNILIRWLRVDDILVFIRGDIMEKVINVTEVNLIDPSLHTLIWDIAEQMGKHNQYEAEEMTVLSENEFLALYIGDRKITVGEDFEVLKRIKQINHENGNDF